MDSSQWPADWIRPEWPVPEAVHAVITTRRGAGESRGAFGALDGGPGLNLGLRSGDDATVVLRNRALLAQMIGVPPVWLSQVHGVEVVKATRGVPEVHADASWTDAHQVALGILVADCMPVLFTDRLARVVAAAHAGWRGLANGVLERTVAALPVPRDDLVAFLGPVIGADHYEVGDDVYHAFVERDAAASGHFAARANGKWLADLPGLARQRLSALGVRVYGEPTSTVGRPDLFYSYRRDQVTGRMAALIWLSARPSY